VKERDETEYFEASLKKRKGRGRARASVELINIMRDIAKGDSADHRPGHRLQTVHHGSLPRHEHENNGRGLSAAQGSA
jgi:hypothetical protein